MAGEQGELGTGLRGASPVGEHQRGLFLPWESKGV